MTLNTTWSIPFVRRISFIFLIFSKLQKLSSKALETQFIICLFSSVVQKSAQVILFNQVSIVASANVFTLFAVHIGFDIACHNSPTISIVSQGIFQANLTASNNEIEIKGGTESIGIYAPASTVSTVGKVTMATIIKMILIVERLLLRDRELS